MTLYMSKLSLNVLSRVFNKQSAQFEVLVEKGLCNNFGVVHGGAVHLIYLNLAKEHLMTQENLKQVKVESVDVEFISSFKEGEVVKVETSYSPGVSKEIFMGSGQIQTSSKTPLALCSCIITKLT